MFAWTFFVRRWKGVVSLAAGVAAVSALAGGALLATGSLGPMVQHFAWTASQYSTANRFPYGGIIGGYPALFSDVHGLNLGIHAILVFFIALPAVVPICALLGFSAARQLWKTPLLFILACAIAAILACAPRMDVEHLRYSSPLSYVVASCALASLLPRIRGKRDAATFRPGNLSLRPSHNRPAKFIEQSLLAYRRTDQDHRL